MIPGWPYSVLAALEPGQTSWTAVLDAVRLGPDDDETAVTAVQVREVVTRLIEAGHWCDGDLRILVVFDAGYDVTRLAYLLADLPVELLGRLRSDRVMQLPAPPRQPGTNGRPRKHGGEMALADLAACPAPQVTISTPTSRYGTAVATAWDRVHPRLTHPAAWLEHDGPLPVIEGTLIRLRVDHLPGDRDPKPVWLWWSRTSACPADVDRLWQAFLRRFDLDPREGPLPGQCTETGQARPRTPARIEEPPPRTPARRGKNHQTGTHAQGTARTRRLNDKLRFLTLPAAAFFRPDRFLRGRRSRIGAVHPQPALQLRQPPLPLPGCVKLRPHYLVLGILRLHHGTQPRQHLLLLRYHISQATLLRHKPQACST